MVHNIGSEHFPYKFQWFGNAAKDSITAAISSIASVVFTPVLCVELLRNVITILCLLSSA